MHDNETELPFATLRLFSDSLRPQVVGGIMNMKPDAAAAKGDGLLNRGDGTKVPARTGTWFITTERRVHADKPEDHLSWLLTLLLQHCDQLRKIMPDIRADICLLIHDRNFELANLPIDLLERTVAAGDLEIEVPERGIDIVLTPRNILSYFPQSLRRAAQRGQPRLKGLGETEPVRCSSFGRQLRTPPREAVALELHEYQCGGDRGGNPEGCLEGGHEPVRTTAL
jgi:hypothetical protein